MLQKTKIISAVNLISLSGLEEKKKLPGNVPSKQFWHSFQLYNPIIVTENGLCRKMSFQENRSHPGIALDKEASALGSSGLGKSGGISFWACRLFKEPICQQRTGKLEVTHPCQAGIFLLVGEICRLSSSSVLCLWEEHVRISNNAGLGEIWEGLGAFRHRTGQHIALALSCPGSPQGWNPAGVGMEPTWALEVCRTWCLFVCCHR